jgi:hypothetical protein
MSNLNPRSCTGRHTHRASAADELTPSSVSCWSAHRFRAVTMRSPHSVPRVEHRWRRGHPNPNDRHVEPRHDPSVRTELEATLRLGRSSSTRSTDSARDERSIRSVCPGGRTPQPVKERCAPRPPPRALMSVAALRSRGSSSPRSRNRCSRTLISSMRSVLESASSWNLDLSPGWLLRMVFRTRFCHESLDSKVCGWR